MERSADGALTGYTLPPSVWWEALSPLLRWRRTAGGAVAVMADAWLDGEDLPPTVCYAVDVQAEITCRDGAFTVQAFHLNVLKD